MVGPFKKAPGGFTHLFVAVDKFTKWIEAKPVSKLTPAQAVSFIFDIIHRYGAPNSIITDNGTQFTGTCFLEFCEAYGIRIDWAAVAHPRANGQVERANGMVLQGLKPWIFDKLNKFVGRWIEELPAVLWSLRTTPSRATGFSPFFLVYGAEAVLPTDLLYGSPRVAHYDEGQAVEAQQDAVDQLDEARDNTTSEGSADEHSVSVTSSCGASRTRRTSTSYRCPGKAPTPSPRSSAPAPTGSKTTKAASSTMPGTSNS